MPRIWRARSAGSACALLAVALAFGGEGALRVAAARQVATPTGSTTTGLIVGRTLDRAGKPIPDVIVELYVEGWSRERPDGSEVTVVASSRRRARTNEQGEFLFADLPETSVTLQAHKPGYEDGAFARTRPQGPSDSLHLAAGERRTDVTITLWKHATVSGVVTDEAGSPLVGEMVYTARRTIVAGHVTLQLNRGAATDDSGTYRIPGVLPGTYAVVFVGQRTVLSFAADDGRTAATRSVVYPAMTYPAAAADGDPASVTIGAGDDLRDVDFRVTPVAATRVSGIVRGPNGPMANVQIFANAVSSGALAGGNRGAMSGADGRFTIDALPAGSYVLRARKEPPQEPWQNPPGAVTIQIGSGTSTMYFGPQSPQVQHVSTEPTLWADMSVVITDSDVSGIEMSLRPSITVTGRLEFEGTTPAPTSVALQTQTSVILEPADPSGVNATRRVQISDGRFSIFGVTPGRYVVRARTSWMWTLKSATLAGLDVTEQPLTISTKDLDGLTLLFTDRHSRINGTVRDSMNRPAAGANVLCFPADRSQWVDYGPEWEHRRMVSQTTPKDGSYNFDLLPGNYLIVATLGDPRTDWQDPVALEALAGFATPVTIYEGDIRKLDLQARQVK